VQSLLVGPRISHILRCASNVEARTAGLQTINRIVDVSVGVPSVRRHQRVPPRLLRWRERRSPRRRPGPSPGSVIEPSLPIGESPRRGRGRAHGIPCARAASTGAMTALAGTRAHSQLGFEGAHEDGRGDAMTATLRRLLNSADVALLVNGGRRDRWL
jgi:hypothetical protein